MKRQLSWLFKNEEDFSDYIELHKLEEIGRIIGKKLLKETSEREKKADYGDHIGTLRVDIRVETEQGEYVIIENQYNKTNHDHFGKIFTYATMLSSEQKSVSDAVWIVEKVREEHFNAVNIINDLLKKRGINFKIWLLVASLIDEEMDKKSVNESTVELRFPISEDFFVRGTMDYDDPKHRAELDEFMPELMQAIADELVGWNKPHRAPSTLHCITVNSNRTEPYDYNIPFRVNEKYIKVEARFTDDFYKKWIENNWENLINETICENDEFSYYYKLCSIDYAIYSSYIKIFGFVKADITNEGKWSYYIDQTVDLIRVITAICEKVERI